MFPSSPPSPQHHRRTLRTIPPTALLRPSTPLSAPSLSSGQLPTSSLSTSDSPATSHHVSTLNWLPPACPALALPSRQAIVCFRTSDSAAATLTALDGSVSSVALYMLLSARSAVIGTERDPECPLVSCDVKQHTDTCVLPACDDRSFRGV